MKIKDGCEASTSEFWYDLTGGGHIDPEDILEKKEDIDKVNKAIQIVMEYEQSCEEQIEGFIQ